MNKLARRAADLWGRRSPERAVAIIGLVSLLLVFAGVVGLGVVEWRRMWRDAEQQSSTAALFLADHASRLFEGADFAIREAANVARGHSWDDLGDSDQVWRRLKDIEERLPYVEAIWLNDEAGRLRLTTFAYPTPESTVADRDFFKAQITPNDRLYISSLIYGRVTERPSFLLTRRLANPDGTLRGIVSVTANLSYFDSLYTALSLPYSPRVSVFRYPELDVIAQNRQVPGDTLTLHHEPERLRAAIAEHPIFGTVWGPSVDGEERVYAYHKVADLPLYVTVDTSRRAVAAAWRAQAIVAAPLALAALLALAGLSAVALVQVHRSAGTRAALERGVADRTRELQAATDQLTTLFQEIHHRVKNNLQVVVSLLRLQVMRMPAPEMKEALRESIERVQAMGLVHEMLYGSQHLAEIDFAVYVDRLAQQLVGSYGMADRITLVTRASQSYFNLDTAIPLGLTLNEVLSNALKHAYPDGREGHIEIRLAREGDEQVLAIFDDGCGFPPGFAWEQADGLGLRIVRSLSTQLRGTPSFESGDRGTRFELRFPAPPPRAAA